MLYLIKSSNYLKIGYTSNLKTRLQDYNTHNPDYILLDTCNGNLNDEAAIHNILKEYQYRSEWFHYNKKILDIWEECKVLINSGKQLQKTKSKKLSPLQFINSLQGENKVLEALKYLKKDVNTKYRIDILIYLCQFVNYNSGTLNLPDNFKKDITELFKLDYTQVCQTINLFIKLGLIEGNNKYIVISKNLLKFNSSKSKSEFMLNIKNMLKL